ncbi:SpoIIE family protein phosphatase [Acidiferrimicrobium sp. IK]|uniref:PP2C family protein-serine/threonine phosphatase n=1 Tax=Acidiferrimicrobium sp. IK TaxID=2871700 RepID=UPI0021CB7066|nr:GAF domain-containing SpoIIE family protein phosphatase [Acidiferrimicrobium sp. IK]MCU4183028.1 SpoIIE family protein phosphatase [Acidiferrimicrobium sp. IK]
MRPGLNTLEVARVAIRELVGRLLPALDLAFPTAVLREVTDFLTETVRAEHVSLWLADYDQDLLGGLSGPEGVDIDERVAVGDSPIGEAYATQRTITVRDSGRLWVNTPITLRGDRIGVLRVGCPDGAVTDPEDFQAALGDIALTLAYVLSLAPRYTDVFERARRQQPLSVAAEMQWSVLPARAFASAAFSLAGALIPAYDVGGDVYDFAVDTDRLWVTGIDAMGHGVSASVLAALTSHTLRNTRRGGADVVEQVNAADRALVEVFGGDQFVTALVAEVDLDTGRCRFVNAGHPSLLLLRDATVQELAETPNVPLGLFTDSTFLAIDSQLQPGDRLVLVSDGVVEAALDEGAQYGDARLSEQILATRSLSPQATVRAIQRHLIDTVGDRLHDDATLLVLDWHGTDTQSPSD